MFSRMIKRFSSFVAMAVCVIAISVCSGFSSGGENDKVLYFDINKGKQINLVNIAKIDDYVTVKAYDDQDVIIDTSYLILEAGKIGVLNTKDMPDETVKIEVEFNGNVISNEEGIVESDANKQHIALVESNVIGQNSDATKRWNVDFRSQLSYESNMKESACGPTSVAMLLKYYYPNSGINMPEIYHAGVMNYTYSSGPAIGYKNISCAGGDSCYSTIKQEYKSYYTGSSYGNIDNIKKYLKNIWNINTPTSNLDEDGVYRAIQSGPLLGHVYRRGNINWGHFIVICGIDTKGTIIRSDDTIFINEPYEREENKGKDYPISYNDFFKKGPYGTKWFRDAVQLIPNESDTQRKYTVVVDTGNNNFEGNSNLNSFILDSKDEKDSKDNFVWKFYYGQGGDWYFPDGKSGRKATWKPRIAANGNYQVSVKYKADKESGTVTYSIYNSSGKLLQSTDVNQYSLQASWKDNVIADNIYLENGYYVQAWNIPSGTNIDAVKFKYLGGVVQKPTAPSSMSATTLSSSSIKLTWTDSSNNETGFYFYRWNGSSWSKIATLGANTTSYTDTGLSSSATYYYTVASYNSAGLSQLSKSPGYISGSTQAEVRTGGIYGKLHINSASGSALSGATVTCGGKSTTTDSSGKYSLSGVPVGSQTLSFSKSGYQSYQKSITISGGTSLNAGDSYLTANMAKPAAPSSMSATALSSSSIKLSWTDSSNNETGFYLYRTTGGAWELIATLGANTTSHTDTGLRAKTNYYYSVLSYNSAGSSQLSQSPGYVSVSTLAAPVTTGSVYGKLHINSASGSALSGATVTCGGKSTTTDSSGKYSLSGVPVGSQTLSFSKSGYQSYQKTVTISGGTSLNAGDNYLLKNADPVPGSVSVNPSSGSWSSSPKYFDVSSSGATVIYYRMSNTYDESTPSEPSAPTPSSNDGSISGSSGTFQYYGSTGKLKRTKIKFVGCNSNGCGTPTGTLAYSIDLKWATAPGSVSVSPSSGSWSSSPKYLDVSSSGATVIYYRMSNTYDGSKPSSPSAPTPSSNDGSISGPSGTFKYYASSGQYKRTKLKFVGCNSAGCGTPTDSLSYKIDRR